MQYYLVWLCSYYGCSNCGRFQLSFRSEATDLQYEDATCWQGCGATACFRVSESFHAQERFEREASAFPVATPKLLIRLCRFSVCTETKREYLYYRQRGQPSKVILLLRVFASPLLPVAGLADWPTPHRKAVRFEGEISRERRTSLLFMHPQFFINATVQLQY